MKMYTQLVDKSLGYSANRSYATFQRVGVSSGVVAVVCALFSGYVLTRMLAIGVIPGVRISGFTSDLVKASPLVLVVVMLIFYAPGRRIEGHVLKPLLRDPLIWFVAGTQCSSAIMSDMPGKCLAFVVVLLLLFLTVRLLVAIASDVEILTALALFSAITVTSMLLFTLYASSSENKVNGIMDIADNTVGGIGMIAGCFAFACRRKLHRFVCFVAALASVVLMGSRAALLGLVTCLMIVCFSLKQRAFIIVITAILVAVIMLNIPVVETHVSEILEKTLQLGDPERGYGSGFTGRVDIWRNSWSLFLERPLLGTGPRTQGDYEILGWVGAHNGYIATLLEVGLLGSIPVFALLIRGIVWTWRREKNHGVLGRTITTAAIAIAVRAIFENQMFNGIGLPTITLVLWLEYVRPTGEPRMRTRISVIPRGFRKKFAGKYA